MKCAYHPDRDAVGLCVSCGRFVCSECKAELGGKIYCNSCADKQPSAQAPEPAGATSSPAAGLPKPSSNVRAGDCCDLCKRNYEGEHNWGFECPNCISKLPNDLDFQILARFCRDCRPRMDGVGCPYCGAALTDSIL
ncbi:hypothetical protein ACFLU4_03680 [Chloroflexota bacterium]